MAPWWQASLTAVFIAGLCLAIWRTDNESWLTAWFLLLFFAGVPLALLSLRDLVVRWAPRRIGRSQLLLHLCALFGAVIGYIVGVMAVASEHPKAHLHQLMVLVFPILVYLAPLLMVVNGTPFAAIKRFYVKAPDEDDA